MIDTPAPPLSPDEVQDPAMDLGDESSTDRTSGGVTDLDAPVDTAPGSAGAMLVDLDPAAVDLARAAAVEESGHPDRVGMLQGASTTDGVAVEVVFDATEPGYRGWTWSVVLAMLDGAAVTVSEAALLPGTGSLLAPAWVPWQQRVRPEDLGPGDLLPPPPDDPRTVPAYVHSDDPAVEEVAHELGIGRVRVLSREGREDAAERWHDGPFGPDDPTARLAPATCRSCAFYLPLAGSLGVLVGACANEYSPADGRVVDVEFGCGAHSETVIELPPHPTVADSVIDELRLEMHDRPHGQPDPVADVEFGDAPGAVEIAAAVEVVAAAVEIADVDIHVEVGADADPLPEIGQIDPTEAVDVPEGDRS